MTHSYVWHDSSICVTWLTHMCDMTHPYVWHDSLIDVTRLIHMYDMTHSYVWHDSSICVTWLIHMCDMTHLYVWHDWSICANVFVRHVCGFGMFHWSLLYVMQDSFVSSKRACDMTHSYVWHDSSNFRKWTPQWMALLRKETWDDSLLVFTPQHTATHRNIPQHTATHRNTPQHTATEWMAEAPHGRSRVFKYMHIHTFYLYSHDGVYVDVFIYTRVCIHVYTFIRIYMYTYAYVHLHIYIHTNTNPYIHIYIHVCIYSTWCMAKVRGRLAYTDQISQILSSLCSIHQKSDCWEFPPLHPARAPHCRHRISQNQHSSSFPYISWLSN